MALVLSATMSSNLISKVVPLCQCTVTVQGNPAPVRNASTMPALKAAQFSPAPSDGTNLLTKGSFSIK